MTGLRRSVATIYYRKETLVFAFVLVPIMGRSYMIRHPNLNNF